MFLMLQYIQLNKNVYLFEFILIYIIFNINKNKINFILNYEFILSYELFNNLNILSVSIIFIHLSVILTPYFKGLLFIS